MSARILVATDGKAGALGALRAAAHLAERDGASVHLLAVCEPVDVYPSGSAGVIPGLVSELTARSVAALRDRVGAQVAGLGDGAAEWTVQVEVGSIAPSVARVAAQLGAELIVVGLREPGSVERWLSRETLLRLIHLSHVPVLAVGEYAKDLPGRIVLAVDFSDFSLRAAREVMARAAAGARIHLAHVSWAPAKEHGWAEAMEWERTYRAGVERRLEELATELRSSGDITVRTHVLTGEAGRELLRLAEQVDADLIAAGSHGAGFLGRIVMGSVSSTLVHGARCSLLIAPPRAVAAELKAGRRPTRLELTEEELLANLGRAGDLALSDGGAK